MDDGLSAAKEAFLRAEQLLNTGDLEDAAEKYLEAVSNALIAPYCYYKLADISNRTNDPLTASDLYYTALSLKPDLFSGLLDPKHPNHDYVFTGKAEEKEQENCPLCGRPGEARWCYASIEMPSKHVRAYNPVRVWMYCGDCHHMFAQYFPEDKPPESAPAPQPAEKAKKKTSASWAANHVLFPHYAKILSGLVRFAEGNDLFEIGLGGCECSLAAREMGFNVFGIDISEGCVSDARDVYGLEAELHDFVEFETDKKWDIIIMGDVLEHVSDPIRALEKAHELLKDNGALWISTPNFESSFSYARGHSDAMRREASHRNYFSRHSLFNLLARLHFIPVDYQISSHYNGSMEIIAVKEDGNRQILP